MTFGSEMRKDTRVQFHRAGAVNRGHVEAHVGELSPGFALGEFCGGGVDPLELAARDAGDMASWRAAIDEAITASRAALAAV